jgi:hypothetical protein
MPIQTIKKSIDINAPKEKVWDVLFQDHFNRIWFAEFSPGTYADTDWHVGSKVIFTDNSGGGIIGKITVNNPHAILSIEYDGILVNGKEDFDSEGAKQMKGARETYELTQKDGITYLSIAGDIDLAYFDEMSLAWDRAMQKIKDLSEGKEQ